MSSSPTAGRTAWARNLATPLRGYLHAETGGAVVLALAAVVALIWANASPSGYESFWHTWISISVGDHHLATDAKDWVNSGLMTLFFLVVGLEAKRELDLGELREKRRLAIPVVAALGGMTVAATTFIVINAGGDGARGWGAAVSTDTALALGALALVTGGRAIRLRVFLVTVVVIDDLVSLLIIALAYTEEVSWTALATAIVLFGVLISLRWAGSWRAPLAVLTGVGIWMAMFESGVDAVIAGLAIGLITSAYPPPRDQLVRSTELTRSFREQPTPELAYSARASLTAAISPNERLQYLLHPWTSRVIVPLFALANAGIPLDGDSLSAAATSPVTIGIVLAFLVGKPVGNLLAVWIATRPMLGGARLTITWPALIGGALSGGVGFTVSLLVASLAFKDGPLLNQAKIGLLITALASPFFAWLAFKVMQRLPEELRARQLGNVVDTIIDLADDVDPERDHIRGDADAPVTLIEYGDFECPYCGNAEPLIVHMLDHLGHDLRFVFRHLPLTDVHPRAQLAAEAAEAAADQGAFWPMHDRLMAHQEELTPADLYDHAAALGLDLERFAEDVRKRRFAPRVATDVMSADASGVAGTPTFFINGRRHEGVYDEATLTAAVKTAARAAQVGARVGLGGAARAAGDGVRDGDGDAPGVEGLDAVAGDVSALDEDDSATASDRT
jgi:Na+/H+ antiporter NhaA